MPSELSRDICKASIEAALVDYPRLQARLEYDDAMRLAVDQGAEMLSCVLDTGWFDVRGVDDAAREYAYRLHSVLPERVSDVGSVYNSLLAEHLIEVTFAGERDCD